jgi:hypothetical protein
MPEPRDLPTGTAEDSDAYDSQVEDISNLLEDPETDPQEKDQDQAKAGPDDDESEVAEDVDTEDAEDPDGSDEPDLKGGRFAPDSAKVTLEDGTVTTVAELKRGHLYQRDYTKKTTEVAELRKSVEAKDAEVSQYAQALNQSREYLAWFAETKMPKRPEPFQGNPIADPAGYLQHQHAENQWRDMQEAFQAFQMQRQQEEQRFHQEQSLKGQEKLRTEGQKLAEAFPVLKDTTKRQAWFERLENGAAKYFGISAEEVRSVGDHRMLKALYAAVDRERIREKAPQVKEEVHKRPIGSGKRLDPKATGSRGKQVRSERLRNSGSFNDGVAALMDLDL